MNLIKSKLNETDNESIKSSKLIYNAHIEKMTKEIIYKRIRRSK